MLKAKDVFTKQGQVEFDCHIHNLDNGVFWLVNHEEDLEMNDEELETLYAMQRLIAKIQEEQELT